MVAQLVKNTREGHAGDPGSIPGLARSTGEGNRLPTPLFMGFPCGSEDKESACNAGVLGLTLGWEDSLEEGVATDSCFLASRIPMNKGAWRATGHGLTKSQTRLSD